MYQSVEVNTRVPHEDEYDLAGQKVEPQIGNPYPRLILKTSLLLSLQKKEILLLSRMTEVLSWIDILLLQTRLKQSPFNPIWMNLLTTIKSDNVEEELTLQEEIEDRENALEELTSILGGSSSCPSFAPSVKFERPGCIPKFNHKRSSRMNFTGILRKPERASFNLYSSLSSHKKDSSGMYSRQRVENPFQSIFSNKSRPLYS